MGTPSSGRPKRSLWHTPAAEGAASAAQASHRRVSPEEIKEAIAATKARTAAFATRVSEELLRTRVE